MGYRSESSSPVTETVKVRKDSSVFTQTVLTGRSRSQYGYRSGPLTALEQRGIKSNNANQVTLIDELEEQTGTGIWSRGSRAFMVHDRDYTETSYTPGRFGYYGLMTGSGISPTGSDISSYLSVSSVTMAGFPAMPTVASLQGEAAAMMRATAVSLRPRFNILQSVLELKDAKRMLRAADFSSKMPKYLGDQYLNFAFGVRPTANDLANAAYAIVRLEPELRAIAYNSTVQQRRTTKRTLSETALSGEISTRSAPLSYSANVGPFSFKAPYATPYTSGSRGAVVASVFGWYAKQTTFIKQFGTWEFFIPKPEEFNSRLDRYLANAKRMLGATKLDESVVWELTPWTWLTDWYIDIGGILRYQIAINDNRIVAVSSGYSLIREARMGVSFRGQYYDPTGVLNPYVWDQKYFQGCSATANYRAHYRRAGNPYSMQPSWALSGQQWAILGALGLARGAGNAIKG